MVRDTFLPIIIERTTTRTPDRWHQLVEAYGFISVTCVIPVNDAMDDASGEEDEKPIM
jgi:hypothetical protein